MAKNVELKSKNRFLMFKDPRVKLMGFFAVGLIIFYLALIASALMMGVIGTETPQTLSEKNLLIARTKVEQGSRLEKDWADYAAALLSTGQASRAQSVMDQARKAKILDPSKRWLDIVQSRLYLSQEKYSQAIKAAQVGLDGIVDQTKKDLATYKKTGKPTTLTAGGVGENFFVMVLLKAEAQEKSKKPKDAIVALTQYLAENPTASDILEWRGDLYRQTGDDKKALKDYKDAVKYLEDKSGLNKKIKEIGAKNGN